MNLSDARARAEKLKQYLAPYCQQIEIAGSVRRGNKAVVKDVELVAIAGKPLLDFLDDRLLQGTITKAVYTDKNGKKSYRWGTLYRGFMWADVRFEIFLADTLNFGYQYWLRTGPDDGNTAVMVAIWKKHAPFRFKDGYCYMMSPISVARERRKIPIPDERMLFALLGLPFIEPKDRIRWRYEKLFYAAGHEWGAPKEDILP